ncbi:mite allergen Lep d 7-like [Tachypleus tridentatus]|uniref:mite allergen Lep d 7-like n=1 Tax=Tachypleus tridentatus TaxID=6853 RepID=UPI003FD2A165
MKIALLLTTQIVILFFSHQGDGHQIEKRQVTCPSVANINNYLDQVISNARSEIPDPLRLPDKNDKVELRNGKIEGLSTLYRSGDAKISCTGSAISLEVNLGVRRLKGRYDWKKKILFIKFRGSVGAEVRTFSVYGKITQKIAPGAHPSIEKLDITSLKRLKIRITGLGPITWALSQIATLLGRIFKKAIANALEKPIRKALNKQLQKINLPIP